MQRTVFPALLAYRWPRPGAGRRLSRRLAGNVECAPLPRPAIAVEKQNTFVKTHCAVCHNDRANNGGLSLEGFDGATRRAQPGGDDAEQDHVRHRAGHGERRRSRSRPLWRRSRKGMKTGAINASGNGVPDKATVDGLVAAFAAQSAGASNVERGAQEGPRDERGGRHRQHRARTAVRCRCRPDGGDGSGDVPPRAHVQRRHAQTGRCSWRGRRSPSAARSRWRSTAAGDELHGGGHRAHGQRHVSNDRTCGVRVRAIRRQSRSAHRFRRARSPPAGCLPARR